MEFEAIDKVFTQALCEDDHLHFSRYFFKARQSIKFKVNWHHALIADKLQEVIDGKIENLAISVPPGSSKTEMAVINFMARGLAINPRARFLHLSGSDTLALLNSSTARDIITSDTYQALWPLKIKDDSKSKKLWHIAIDGQEAGGVYATSLGGQITGFRAGHMTEGFQGAIIIDDPLKPEDAFSKNEVDKANRKLISTVKSRKANPKTPVVIIMQRLSENDPLGFCVNGNLDLKFEHVCIPALIDDAYVQSLAPRYQAMIEESPRDDKGRFSYWPYKEPLEMLLAMEKGGGIDQNGARISRFVFNSQYQQSPTALGGNIIKGQFFVPYTVLPKIKYRKVYGDTAQKTKERNDQSCFEEWGYGEDGRSYLIDLIVGKWEAPELQKMAVAFWAKAKGRDREKFGALREMLVEDKSSGTGLIQTIKLPPYNIPVKGIEREKDKLTRVMDALPYIETSLMCVPIEAPFTMGFIQECEAFTNDDSHEYDDQVDPMVDMIEDMHSSGNKLKQWEQLGKGRKPEQVIEVNKTSQAFAQFIQRLDQKGKTN